MTLSRGRQQPRTIDVLREEFTIDDDVSIVEQTVDPMGSN